MYCYYCTQRPPAPGAIPKGCIEVEDFDERNIEDLGGHWIRAYGKIWYDRKLTDQELYGYELTPAE